MKFDPRLFYMMRSISPLTGGGRENFISWLDAVMASTEVPPIMSEADFQKAKLQAQQIKNRLEGATP